MSKVIVKTEDLRRILKNVKNGVSKLERPLVSKGIRIEVKKTTLTMITCDGYKILTSSCEIIEGEEFTAITPIFRIPKNASENTIIEIDKEVITFDYQEEKQILKLIKGEFINWESFFNREINFKISFNVKLLQDALKGEEGVINLDFSDSKSPMFINGKKLVLPVRNMEE